ncbi:MAG: hypothetical protein J5449_09155 [Oscillospiraceae bacterium]|nr:hypothetical protein [Oscillospiraceae bacterium]
MGGALDCARDAGPLWLPDLRAAFAEAEDAVPLAIRLCSYDGRTRLWRHRIPRWTNEKQRGLARDYLCASVYNAMSACCGYELAIFTDTEEQELIDLIGELPEIFQLSSPKRSGLGKVVSVANRMGNAFFGKQFHFTVSDIKDLNEDTEPVPFHAEITEMLRAVCREADGLNIIGIDVGGTDIKLAASARGRLAAVKEYDWNPSAFKTAEQLIEPILLLTRLMRACIALEKHTPALRRALEKDASEIEMRSAVEEAESICDCGVLDKIGLSFPDVVLYDRIVGGETPKTDGMRHNQDIEYETEFAKLGELGVRLRALCRGEGGCRIVNDGSMAAFSAAMELCCGNSPEAVKRGVLAHSLGTDLGTGWVDGSGRIPQLPLEIYDLWLDLGSAEAASLPPEDLRGTRNENSGLPGARRYLGQSAAFRLAWELDPRLLDGFTEERDGVLRIRTEPDDLRKPCLEYLMRRASEGNAAAEEIFRCIGRNLAVITKEAEWLLRPETDVRYLFGRFVKSEKCFSLLREGFSELKPEIRLENGGDDLAETPLMRQLAQREDVTVAQFAQSVGSVYFALTEGERREA